MGESSKILRILIRSDNVDSIASGHVSTDLTGFIPCTLLVAKESAILIEVVLGAICGDGNFLAQVKC